MLHEHGCAGTIFNIQRFSLHDGPGIRTLIFLKGCPLKCRWCSNPEGMSGKIEILCRHNKCIGCGACLRVCPRKAVSYVGGTGYIIDRSLCDGCGECAKFCPSKAKEKCGEVKNAEEILEVVQRDLPFYKSSGGGLTMGGGEVLFQPRFTYEILKQAKELGVNTAVETSGYAQWPYLEKLVDYCDTIHYDLKTLESGKHKQITGVDNKLILDNLAQLDRKIAGMSVVKPDLVLRLPLIDGYNDSWEEIKQMAEFIKNNIRSYTRVEILPFHNLGEQKYEQLGLAYELAGRKNTKEEKYNSALSLMREMGLEATVSKW